MHFLHFPEETVMQMTGSGPWELFTTDIEEKSGAKATGSVSVRSIRPAAGTTVSDDATINATVDYAIDNFKPDTFHLSLQLETTTPGRTVGARVSVVGHGDAPPPLPRLVTLTAAKGTATVLARVADVPAGEVKKPLRLKVYLHEATSDRTSRVVATTEWIAYR